MSTMWEERGSTSILGTFSIPTNTVLKMVDMILTAVIVANAVATPMVRVVMT